MDKTVVIGGQVQLLQTIDGTAQLTNAIDGQYGSFYEVSHETHETYAGPYEVTPSTIGAQTLETADKILSDDVTVNKIPYWETSNQYGITVYIGNDVEV